LRNAAAENHTQGFSHEVLYL